ANLEPGRGERADGRLPARPRSLDEDVDLAHAVLHRPAGGRLGGELGSEWGGLARSLEADLAGRGPRDHGTGRVGDRDDRVVEGALDVRLSVRDVLAFLAADLLGGRGSGSSLRWHKRVRSVMSDCRAAGSWSVVPAGPP